MALKFSGTSTDFALRWYDTASGKISLKRYSDEYATETEFSRNVLKTKKLKLTIHPDHKPDPNGFWINGYQADENKRITFATGTKDKFVISKNEVDFLFCTSDQPFSSCYRLENGTSSSLKKMCACEGIYITYTTQQDSTYTFDGTEYTHPKMSGRAFLYESEDKRHYLCGRPYGKQGFELRDALRRWLPNGLERYWELSDKQMELAYFEKDNFNEVSRKAIHDCWDNVFNTGELYDSDGIEFVISGENVLASKKTHVETNKARVLSRAKYNKGQKDDCREEQPF